MDARRRALEMAKEEEARAAEEKAVRDREAAAQRAREAAERAAAEAAAAAAAPADPAESQAKDEAAPAAAAPQSGTAAERAPTTTPAQPATAAVPAAQPEAPPARPQGLRIGVPTIVHPSADKQRTERRPIDTTAKRKPEAETEPEEEARGGGPKKGGKGGAKVTKAPVRGPGEQRERGKLTINNAFDEAQRQRSLASLQRRRERDKRRQAGVQQPRDKVMREVIIPEVITIQELANRMTERAVDVIRLLMGQGAMHKINDAIDADTAELIVREFGHTPKRVAEVRCRGGLHRHRRR